MKGRVVKTLAEEQASPGSYEKVRDINNAVGQRVPGGGYVTRLIAGEFQAIQPMVLAPRYIVGSILPIGSNPVKILLGIAGCGISASR